MVLDTQKDKVYQAENMVVFFFSDHIKHEEDLDFWRAYCKSLLKKDWFKEKYNLKKIHIFDLDNEDPNKVAASVKRGNRGTIFLSKQGRYELTILHEISHLVDQYSHDKKDYHGQEYVENMINLTSNQMGFTMESYLIQAYLFYNVQWYNRSEYVVDDLVVNHPMIHRCPIENSGNWEHAKSVLKPIIEYFSDFDISDCNQKEFQFFSALKDMMDPKYCPVYGQDASCEFKSCDRKES